jgi:hypothetical protein
MSLKPGDPVTIEGLKGKHKVEEIGSNLTRVIDERQNDFWVPNRRVKPAKVPAKS